MLVSETVYLKKTKRETIRDLLEKRLVSSATIHQPANVCPTGVSKGRNLSNDVAVDRNELLNMNRLNSLIDMEIKKKITPEVVWVQ